MNRVATAVCALILCAGLANAQSDLRSGPYILGGMVMTPHSKMNGDMEIRLLNDGDVPVATLRAYTEMQFTFRGLPAGTYYLEIEASGYRTVRERVDLVGGLYENNIPITLEAQSDGAPFGGSSGLSGEDDVINIADMSRSPELKKKFQEATKKLNSGDVNGARARLESILSAAPDFYEAHKSLGIVYERSQRYADAEKEFQLARDLRPQSAVPLMHLGGLYLQEVEAGATSNIPAADILAKARTILLRAIQLDADTGFPRYLLGVTYYRLGQYSDSENTLLRALELEPKLGDIRLALANVYIRLQDWSKALTNLNVFLKENPKALDREHILATRAQVERLANNVKDGGIRESHVP